MRLILHKKLLHKGKKVSLSTYIHTTEIHNMDSPRAIVPELIRLFNPSSIVDMGCGLGTFVRAFKEEGISDVLGVDGPWVDHTLRGEIIQDDIFKAHELGKPLSLHQRYDLALSLEVAEHLSEAEADIFIDNLVGASDTIIFSAAIPYQGGQNHINEQWLHYWVQKFKKRGYQLYDVLRFRFWEDKRVFHWYRQNMVVFSTLDLGHLKTESPLDIIHPDFYLNKAVRLENIIQARRSPKFYLKLFFASLKNIFTKNTAPKDIPVFPEK